MPGNVSTVLLNASVALQDDVANVRWGLPELMRYINDGLREILALRPDLFSQTQVHTCAAGTEQEVSGVYSVLRIVANVDPAQPSTIKRVVRRVTMDHLDRFSPDWHQVVPAAQVENYAADQYQRNRFWVFPPNDGTGALRVEVAMPPESVQIAGGADPNLLTSYDIELPLDDAYHSAMTYYVLHRAWAKDADFAANQQNSNTYYEQFKTLLGVVG